MSVPAGRSRVRVASALAVVIVLGLGSRSGHTAIPIWLAANAGDALWTSAVYLGLAFVLQQAPALRLLLLALVISLLVELSQLVQAEWLDAVRATTAGGLLLGSGWQWADLPRYCVGALLAWGLDRTLLLEPRNA